MEEKRQGRGRRIGGVFILAVVVAAVALIAGRQPSSSPNQSSSTAASQTATQVSSSPAISSLAKLPIKGRAPLTGYSRQQFGGSWADEGSCTMRDKILARDLTNISYKGQTCEVATGILNDPYTGKTIHFLRGAGTSTAIQIDHVVALGDAWQTGAQQLTSTTRQQMYNDPLELLAVDGPANEQKGDGDAATWLPPNKAYRCRYVARQIAVKLKYHLWVTSAEHDAMANILGGCPGQQLPAVN